VGSVNASALTALQSRINTERARRGLGNVTFTGGVAAGSAILATHFSELRSATETLNTLGSQTFNWSGTVAAGASITDVLPQIDSYLTTLEGETLASWKALSPSYTYTSGPAWKIFLIPSAALNDPSKLRWKITTLPSYPLNAYNNLMLFYVPSYPPPNPTSTNGVMTQAGILQGVAGTNTGGYAYNTLSSLAGTYGSYSSYPPYPPVQTPYTVDNKSDGNVGDPWRMNYTYGNIAASNGGGGSEYLCSANVWYHPLSPATSSYPYIAVFNAYGYSTAFNSVSVEAYY
jgi:hypothetical protein